MIHPTDVGLVAQFSFEFSILYLWRSQTMSLLVKTTSNVVQRMKLTEKTASTLIQASPQLFISE